MKAIKTRTLITSQVKKSLPPLPIARPESYIENYEIVRNADGNCSTYAKRDIAKGERIISEKPILRVLQNIKNDDASIKDEVDCVSEEARMQFYQLFDAFAIEKEQRTYSGILKTNAIPLGLQAAECGIFPIISRINHSCNPNVHHSWNKGINQACVHALKDIKKGEELFTSYIHIFSDSFSRAKALKKCFNFKCYCEVCSKSKTIEGRKSDERRRRLCQLDLNVVPTYAKTNRLMALMGVKEMIVKMEEEGIDQAALYGRIYYDGLQLCLKDSAIGNSKEWALKAYEYFVIAEGSDNPVCKKIAQYL